MNVIEVANGSPAFTAVVKLWRTESTTLGFMPVGGFEDSARAGCLLAAEKADGGIEGYVMFRRTAQRVAVIVHLCVAREYRGSGTARILFEEVRARCGDCFEIRVRCRRDFPANSLWSRLGFVAVGDVAGRGREGTLVTIWRFETAALPLFRGLQPAPASPNAVQAVIDANVFFDLDESGTGEEESRGLLADWLGEFVELAVTQELFNEINRQTNDRDRDRQRRRANRFIQVGRDIAREEAAIAQVRALLSTLDTPSGRSDARQVAMTIAGKVPFFVTRDQDVLDAADALDDAFDLKVMTPLEIVRRFDELRREEDYRPRRLFFGPRTNATAARADDIEQIVDLMYMGQAITEPRRRTLGRLREMLAAPDRYEAICIRRDGELIAAYVIDRSIPRRFLVAFFGVGSSSLGRTAARHYGEDLVTVASRERRPVVEVRNPGPRVGEALADLGFSKEGETWIKLTLPPVALPPGGVAAEVDRIGSSCPSAAELAQRVGNELRAFARGSGIALVRLAALERALWPAKLTTAGLPCFVVPIQPRWAKELFDRELAEGTLFGANPSLVLNRENVYYRAARPAILTAPARILWYVSDDTAYPQSKAVRACSYIDEVVVGPPKVLFRRFKRLGIYDWKDVFAVAKHDVTNEIMAFRFSKTELFDNPIPWGTMQGIFKAHTDKGSQIQSPIALSEECFFEIYRRGVGASGA